MKHWILLFCIFLCTSNCAPTLFIVIHGTWASQESWGKPGGDFFQALVHAVESAHHSVIEFTWSGKLDNQSRLKAGQELAQFIKKISPAIDICLIGHSHGANVGIIASHELAKMNNNQHYISHFYALAPPVNVSQYMPNMEIINYFYNFFSLQDYVQPVFGIFGRTYPEHSRIANIRVQLEGLQGNHSQMHDPMIAAWLPKIHEYLKQYRIGNFHHFSFGKPGLIYFFNSEDPLYMIDYEQKKLLELDLYVQQKVGDIAFRKPAHAS